MMFQSLTQKPHLLYYLAKAVKIGSFEVLVRLDSSWENIKIHFLLLADRAKQVKNRVFWLLSHFFIKRKIVSFWKKVIKNEKSLTTEENKFWAYPAGLSSLGVPGVPWHTQILADQLTLFQPGGTIYAHLITTGTPGFSDLPTALQHEETCAC